MPVDRFQESPIYVTMDRLAGGLQRLDFRVHGDCLLDEFERIMCGK